MASQQVKFAFGYDFTKLAGARNPAEPNTSSPPATKTPTKPVSSSLPTSDYTSKLTGDLASLPNTDYNAVTLSKDKQTTKVSQLTPVGGGSIDTTVRENNLALLQSFNYTKSIPLPTTTQVQPVDYNPSLDEEVLTKTTASGTLSVFKNFAKTSYAFRDFKGTIAGPDDYSKYLPDFYETRGLVKSSNTKTAENKRTTTFEQSFLKDLRRNVNEKDLYIVDEDALIQWNQNLMSLIGGLTPWTSNWTTYQDTYVSENFNSGGHYLNNTYLGSFSKAEDYDDGLAVINQMYNTASSRETLRVIDDGYFNNPLKMDYVDPNVNGDFRDIFSLALLQDIGASFTNLGLEEATRWTKDWTDFGIKSAAKALVNSKSGFGRFFGDAFAILFSQQGRRETENKEKLRKFVEKAEDLRRPPVSFKSFTPFSYERAPIIKEYIPAAKFALDKKSTVQNPLYYENPVTENQPNEKSTLGMNEASWNTKIFGSGGQLTRYKIETEDIPDEERTKKLVMGGFETIGDQVDSKLTEVQDPSTLTFKDGSKLLHHLVAENPIISTQQFDLYIDDTDNIPILRQAQAKITGNDSKIVKETDFLKSTWTNFRITGLSVPEYKRDAQAQKYGTSVISIVVNQQASADHKASFEIICDMQLDELEYLVKNVGLGVWMGSRTDKEYVWEPSLFKNTIDNTDQEFDLSSVSEGSMMYNKKAYLKIRNGRDMAKLNFFENLDGYDAIWDQFKEEKDKNKNKNSEEEKKSPYVEYYQVPTFVFENFRIINVDYKFSFTAKAESVDILKLKVDATWTKMTVTWDDPKDLYKSPLK